MSLRPILFASLAAFGLAACEGTDLERGALGAGIGGATAAATGGSVAAGAAAGGAAGVVCDDLTPQYCSN